MLVWLMAGAFAADCENPEWVANETEELVVGFLLVEAKAAIDRAEVALGCSGPANPAVLARLMNAEGTIAILQGDLDAAKRSYAAGRRIDATAWKGMYGDDAKALWDASVVDGVGRIELTGLSAAVDTWVDGAPLVLPAEVPAGKHLVQVGRVGGPPQTAKWLIVAPGEAATMRPVLPEPVVQLTPEEQAKLEEDRIKKAVAEALAAQLAAGALAGPTTTVPVVEAVPVVRERRGRPALVLGLTLAGIGAVIGGGTYAVAGTLTDPTTEQRNQLIAANVVGWGLTGLGGVVAVAGLAGGRRTSVPTLTYTWAF